MDGGAWKAAVHGIAKSWTRLSDFTFTFHFHALEKEMATHSSILAWRIPGTEEPGGLPSMGSQSQTRLKRLSRSSSLAMWRGGWDNTAGRSSCCPQGRASIEPVSTVVAPVLTKEKCPSPEGPELHVEESISSETSIQMSTLHYSESQVFPTRALTFTKQTCLAEHSNISGALD